MTFASGETGTLAVGRGHLVSTQVSQFSNLSNLNGERYSGAPRGVLIRPLLGVILFKDLA